MAYKDIPADAVKQAEDWLTAYLTDNGATIVADVKEAAVLHGISPRALKTAVTRLRYRMALKSVSVTLWCIE